jgi:hypothetical protein
MSEHKSSGTVTAYADDVGDAACFGTVQAMAHKHRVNIAVIDGDTGDLATVALSPTRARVFCTQLLAELDRVAPVTPPAEVDPLDWYRCTLCSAVSVRLHTAGVHERVMHDGAHTMWTDRQRNAGVNLDGADLSSDSGAATTTGGAG